MVWLSPRSTWILYAALIRLHLKVLASCTIHGGAEAVNKVIISACAVGIAGE